MYADCYMSGCGCEQMRYMEPQKQHVVVVVAVDVQVHSAKPMSRSTSREAEPRSPHGYQASSCIKRQRFLISSKDPTQQPTGRTGAILATTGKWVTLLHLFVQPCSQTGVVTQQSDIHHSIRDPLRSPASKAYQSRHAGDAVLDPQVHHGPVASVRTVELDLRKRERRVLVGGRGRSRLDQGCEQRSNDPARRAR